MENKMNTKIGGPKPRRRISVYFYILTVGARISQRNRVGSFIAFPADGGDILFRGGGNEKD